MTHPPDIPEDTTENESHAPSDGWRSGSRFAVVFFALTAVAMAADVVADMGGQPAPHVILEILILIAAIAGMAYFWRLWRMDRARAQQLSTQVVALRGETQRWRAQADHWRSEAREALDGLATALDRQFARWELTDAERDVAMLLLKGLALKDAAEVRGTSERTVRQQALAVYRKAGVAGRAELSAFFLEDLLLPATRPGDGVAGARTSTVAAAGVE